jgi:hypothetical protein
VDNQFHAAAAAVADYLANAAGVLAAQQQDGAAQLEGPARSVGHSRRGRTDGAYGRKDGRGRYGRDCRRVLRSWARLENGHGLEAHASC